MGKVRPYKDWQRVADVLWLVWDPIGVNRHPDALGEYDSYTDGILGLLTAKAGRQDVFSYLRHIETEAMGLRHGMTTEAAVDALLALELDGT